MYIFWICVSCSPYSFKVALKTLGRSSICWYHTNSMNTKHTLDSHNLCVITIFYLHISQVLVLLILFPNNNWVVVSNMFNFHHYLGKIPILTNIFQMGWNHQLDNDTHREIPPFLMETNPLGHTAQRLHDTSTVRWRKFSRWMYCRRSSCALERQCWVPPE